MSKRKQKAMNDGHEHADGDAWETPAELKSLEAELAALRLRDDRLDRDMLIFKAGQASVGLHQRPDFSEQPRCKDHWPKSATFWSRSCAAMTVVAASLLAMLLTRPANEPNPVAPTTVVASTNPYPQTPTVYQTNRRLDPHKLSATSYHLKNFDQLLASGSFDSQPADSSPRTGTESDWTHRKILSPTSIHMLLDETAEPNRVPFDSTTLTKSEPVA